MTHLKWVTFYESLILLTNFLLAMSAGYDKEAASKRRGPQKKMRRRIDALNTARPKEIVAE